jgi:hypothetical protein
MVSAIDATREIQQKIGRNLIWIQLIEQRLKIYVSLVEPSGRVKFEELSAEAEKLRKQTFGNLVERLKQTQKFEDSRGEQWLQQLVDSRNELAHHFVEKFGDELFCANGTSKASRWLEQQRLDLRAMYGMVSQSLAALFVTLCETTFKTDEEMRRVLDRLARQFSTSVGGVHAHASVELMNADE